MTPTHDHQQPRLFPLEPDRDQLGYLYAVLMPSHAIKIGWTGRSPGVRARELNGEVLAFTFGTLADEAALHQRVARWRIGRTEDFWPAPDVWNLVDWLKNAA